MTNISVPPLPLLFFLSSVLSVFSLCPVVQALDLSAWWAIEGPDGKICLHEGDGGNVCDDAVSVIRLNYTIHKTVKIAKHEIFKKECEEKFEVGDEPFKSKSDALSLSSPSDSDDTITASIEMFVKEGYLTAPWWRRMSNTEKQQKSIEFCIKMGLWLPPDVGNMMVNFRETNVDVMFERRERVDGEEYAVSNIVLEPKELRKISVDFGGLGGEIDTKKDNEDTGDISSSDEKDEL